MLRETPEGGSSGECAAQPRHDGPSSHSALLLYTCLFAIYRRYIHFYLGRRSTDDARQVSRWQKAVGQTGRFRRAADKSVASRQICWQWAVDAGYEAPEPQAPLVGPDGGDRLRTQDSGDEEGGGANSEDDEP